MIVSHIAIAVSDMAELRKRLEKLNVMSRKNLSVPNPADSDTGIVEQVCTYYVPHKNFDHLLQFNMEQCAVYNIKLSKIITYPHKQ